MAMRESTDLNKLELHDLFANIKAYEFELETRAEAAPSTSQPTKALAATATEQCSPTTSKTALHEKTFRESLIVENASTVAPAGFVGGNALLLVAAVESFVYSETWSSMWITSSHT
ncbi:hypothetical protein F511_37787 [Dorcoceras hygrometricum]|uniref:Uncharacterized protein n=1 Tax=Dorcoceras hygrometricum TaxID=472368 RepID=A0A2Z7CU77_9LAMI|nr:hypothetical protein F511_37787 [Dorcoceras hygrometricum]